MNKKNYLKVSLLALIFVLFQSNLALAGSQSYNSYGTYTFTVPAGVTQIYVSGSGYGGSGDSPSLDGLGNQRSGGGGGSGGNVTNQSVAVTPGSSHSVNIDTVTTFGSVISLTSGGNANMWNPGVGGTPNGVNGYAGDSQNIATAPSQYVLTGAGGGAAACPGCGFGGSGGYGAPDAPSDCWVDPSTDGGFGAGGGGATYCMDTGRGADGAPGGGGSAFIDISWVNPSTGTITVTANNASATWIITGPTTLSGSGLSATYNSQPTGTYTVVWGAIPGYTTPASTSFVLTSGGTLTFPQGNYVPSAAPAVNVNFI